MMLVNTSLMILTYRVIDDVTHAFHDLCFKYGVPFSLDGAMVDGMQDISQDRGTAQLDKLFQPSEARY